MSDLPPDPGLIETLHRAIGGAATAFVAAIAGRGMFHAAEVRAKRRPILSWALAWEIPLAFGMALIGDSIGVYYELPREVTVGLIAALSYLGPRGAGSILEKWATAKHP